MMYPFLQLNDHTEIVHSEILPDQRVKVYIEKPVSDGFDSATCYLPSYKWREIEGFKPADIKRYQSILESTAHLIIRFSRNGGFENAAGF